MVEINLDKCNKCGDCLDKETGCQFLNYDRKRAIKEVTALIEGKDTDILKDCITCQACNIFCDKGVKIFDFIVHRMSTEQTWCSHGKDMWESIPSLFKPYIYKKVGSAGAWLDLCPAEGLLSSPGDMGIRDMRFFKNLNIFGGLVCSVWRTHLGLENASSFEGKKAMEERIKWMYDITGGAKKIIFSHDECFGMIYQAEEAGIDISFEPIHLVQYLCEYVKDHKREIKPLEFNIAHQNSCSTRYGPNRDGWLDELYELIGCERVDRKFDRINQLCCGVPFTIFRRKDADKDRGVASDMKRAAEARKKNIADAKSHDATHLVCICPVCMNFLHNDAVAGGLKPITLLNLVEMAFNKR